MRNDPTRDADLAETGTIVADTIAPAAHSVILRDRGRDWYYELRLTDGRNRPLHRSILWLLGKIFQCSAWVDSEREMHDAPDYTQKQARGPKTTNDVVVERRATKADLEERIAKALPTLASGLNLALDLDRATLRQRAEAMAVHPIYAGIRTRRAIARKLADAYVPARRQRQASA